MISVADFRTIDVPRADLVLCDPPYGLSKVYGGERETRPYEDWVNDLLARTSAPWRLFFGPPIQTIDFKALVRLPDRVLVWTKTMAQIRKTLVGWQYGVTPILVYRDPGAEWFGGSILPGAWDYIAAPSALSEVATVRRYLDGKVHPAVTGTFITRKLVRQITRPGDLVVDPMAGCGSILVGAVREGRRVWGSEIIPEYAAVGNSWLTDEQAKSPFLAARHPDSKETPHD